MFQGGETHTTTYVPNLYGLIVASADDSLPIRQPSDIVHISVMSAQGTQLLTGRRTPDLDRSINAPAGKTFSARGEGQACHLIAMPIHFEEPLSGRRVPNLHGGASSESGCGSNNVASWAISDTSDAPLHGQRQRALVLRGIPEFDCSHSRTCYNTVILRRQHRQIRLPTLPTRSPLRRNTM